MLRNFVTKCAEFLLQNAQKFCYKMRRNFVTKCARCYRMRSCYKMRLNRPVSFCSMFKQNLLSCPKFFYCARVFVFNLLKNTTPSTNKYSHIHKIYHQKTVITAAV